MARREALEDDFAAQVLFVGMIEGWFRSDDAGAQDLSRYFNASTDDPFGAREIIDGDKNLVPSWSGGVSVGQLIEAITSGSWLLSRPVCCRRLRRRPIPPRRRDARRPIAGRAGTGPGDCRLC